MILLVCLTFFFYQSADFYNHYVTYPLSLSIGIESPQRFKKPAVTICNRNPFPRRLFCKEHPDFCEKPTDEEKFCRKHPYLCQGNFTDILIPKLGYHSEEASDDLKQLLWNSYINYSKRDIFHVRDIHSKSRNTWKQIPTVVQYPFPGRSKNVAEGLYIKCVSMNLHLNSKSEGELEEISAEDGELKKIAAFQIQLSPKDKFFIWKEDQLFVAVHSPFVPINPILDGTAVQAGYEYNFHIELETENLQPAPYKTNCTNYDAEWTENNSTGPRSQEMCKEMCSWSFSRKCFGCHKFRLLKTNPKNACLEDFTIVNLCTKDGEYEKLYHCIDNCKRTCRKLKYRYSVTRIENNAKYSEDSENVTISLYIKTDVTVLSHNPLYGHWDIFSYVGGLVGCWMGVSVWTLVGILEKAFRLSVITIRKMKSNSRQWTLSMRRHRTNT